MCSFSAVCVCVCVCVCFPSLVMLCAHHPCLQVNTELETLSYYHANSDARGHIDITLSMGGKSWAQAIPLYDLRRLVTVMAKSFGRLDSLNKCDYFPPSPHGVH